MLHPFKLWVVFKVPRLQSLTPEPNALCIFKWFRSEFLNKILVAANSTNVQPIKLIVSFEGMRFGSRQPEMITTSNLI